MLERLGFDLPIIQAPMAGVSTPELAAAVCEAGALGSISIGATDTSGARKMILDLRSRTQRPFQVNLFAHQKPLRDAEREAAWLSALEPTFGAFNGEPPAELRVIYTSFVEDGDMLRLLIELRPSIVSFHFGLPHRDRLNALKGAGCFLVATVTNLEEARAAERAGIDALVAQGFEAGGHRGTFDPETRDDCLGTLALVRLLATGVRLPIIAAGGIMDGRGIRAALDLGAAAAQLGTAFIGCPESQADETYRAALFGPAAEHTVMTRAISGRPARCLSNLFTALGQELAQRPPDYPIGYDAGKGSMRLPRRPAKAGSERNGRVKERPSRALCPRRIWYESSPTRWPTKHFIAQEARAKGASRQA
jgi:nitronate monooxygenase